MHTTRRRRFENVGVQGRFGNGHAGRRTLTLTNHDDNAAGKATSTRFDNVVLG